MLTINKPFTFATILKCASCHKEYPLTGINTYATCCNQPLIVEYDRSLEFFKSELQYRQHNMWRYAPMLPVLNENNIISLGEGMTPIFSLHKLADRFGFADLVLKDESFNPTGSFKARGLSA